MVRKTLRLHVLRNEHVFVHCCAAVDICFAEPGDIIIVGNGEKAHTVIVSKIVDGHVLVNSNSIDMKDFPIEGYTYTDIVLIKILGSN